MRQLKSYFFYRFRRRSPSSWHARKKNILPMTNNNASTITTKSSERAPLLENTNNVSTTGTKQKLVPERTLHISDVSTSRFKSIQPTAETKDSLTKPDNLRAYTASDSGVYGADLAENAEFVAKTALSLSTLVPSKIHEMDLPDMSQSVPTILVNPLNGHSARTVTDRSADAEIDPSSTIDKEEKKILPNNTVQSPSSSTVDIKTNENEATLHENEPQLRGTSDTKQALSDEASNNIETIVILENKKLSSHTIIPFNPLHVILQKDPNKYYTTEYI